MASGCPMMTMKTASEHPCFGGDHSKAGRIHLPVAPGCNIKCGFCERKFDCANESRPGVTSRVLTPEQAVERVRIVKRHMERQGGARLKVVGIAGPGDPLANPRTFETFHLVREAFPEMTLCLSTNGLRLPEMIDTLKDLDLHSLTVTINALTPGTGAKVYEWIKLDGRRLEGAAAAALLLERQLEGVRLAAAAGLLVKVNHVYIPGINDHETLDLAVRVRGLGAQMMNIIPVIPLGLFRAIEPPSAALMEMVRNQAELILSQARHCKQCRADAAGIVGQDLDLDKLALMAS
ncbi:MAG: radical SAM protein [Deltaproteobacteria bacterium]|nr:MAG: radical SAM protein [Deltaproteobacteria bacterium]